MLVALYGNERNNVQSLINEPWTESLINYYYDRDYVAASLMM